MGEMASADRQAVAVSADGDHGELGIRDFNSLGDGKGAAVNAVEAIGLDEIGEPAGTADPRNQGQLLRGHVQVDERLHQGGKNPIVAASRTPDGVDAA